MLGEEKVIQFLKTNASMLGSIGAGFALFTILAWLTWRAEKSRKLISNFYREPGFAWHLGLIRVVTFTAVFLGLDLASTMAFVNKGMEAQHLPQPWGLFMNQVPTSPEVMTTLFWTLKGLAILGILGLGSRVVAAATCLISLYFFGIRNSYGVVEHSHLIVWFTLILALSRSGDALSLDALLAKRRGIPTPSAPSVAYGAPIRWFWTLTGIIYFFPGLWKLCIGGLAWLSPINLQSYSYNMVQEPNNPILFPIYPYPVLAVIGAVFTIALEIGYIFAVLDKRTRNLAFLSAAGFHVGIFLTLGIDFLILAALNLAFLDWPALLARFQKVSLPQPMPTAWSPRRLNQVVGALAVGCLGFGLLHRVEAWPVACYPTFAKPMDGKMYRIEAEMPDGSVIPLSKHKSSMSRNETRKETVRIIDPTNPASQMQAEYLWAKKAQELGTTETPYSISVVKYEVDFKTGSLQKQSYIAINGPWSNMARK